MATTPKGKSPLLWRLSMNNLETVNVLFCLDNKCFDGLLITCLSMAKTTKHPLNIFIGTGNFITKKKKYAAFRQEQLDFIAEKVKKHNPNISFHLLDLTDEMMEHLGKSVNYNGKFSPLSLIRLLSDFHPEFGNKLLYLDVDLVIMDDIYKVFSTDLGNNDIGMVKDEVGSHWLGKNYCNSGVLLMNLAKLRENHHFDIVRKKVINNKYFMPDQTALNRGLSKTKQILSPRFNDQHFIHEDTVIRHYCQWIKINKKGIGNVAEKPWNVEKFRKTYGEDTHKELLDEFLLLKEEYLKTNK